MSIIDKEDLKYLNKSKNANLKASSSNSIIDEADRKYLNNQPLPPVPTPTENLMKNINTLPQGNLNLGTSSTLPTNTKPNNIIGGIYKTPETIRSATPQESALLQATPADTLRNYAQNTRNKMTTSQKIQEDTNKIALEASNNLIRPLIGYTTGAPEKLIRTAGYGTALALGKITQAQYDKIIKEEENGNPNVVGGRGNTISALIAGDPKVGAAIKLGEDQAYRKIAGAGAETVLNFVLPKVLTGGGGMLRNTLESGVVGAGYGVAQQAQEQNPDYLQGAGYGFAGGALLSGGINLLGKGLGAITSTVEKNALYKSIANTSNKEEIFNNLKSRFPEVSDNLIQGMSDDLSKINTPKGVSDYFTTITKNADITPTYFDENGFIPNQEVSQETPNIVAKENVPTKGQLVPEVPKVPEPQAKFPKPLKNNINLSYTETIPPKVKTSKSVVNAKGDNSVSPENSLISEAKKYKSAEEFVKDFNKNPSTRSQSRPQGVDKAMDDFVNSLDTRPKVRDLKKGGGYDTSNTDILKYVPVKDAQNIKAYFPSGKVPEEITVYRGGGKRVSGSLRDGEYLTTKQGVAQSYGTKFKEFKVKTKDLLLDPKEAVIDSYGNNQGVVVYNPDHSLAVVNKYLKENKLTLTDIWNKAQKVKIPIKKTTIKPETKTEIKPKPQVKTEVKSNTDETFKSRVFERLQKENPDLLEGDLSVSKVNIEKESEKAVKLLKEDKQKLYDIAMGKESSPDLTSTMANITLAERAIEEGNNELASKLIKNRSLAQTRRGQEIVSEKASLTDNSSSRYVKQLLSDRLDEVGKKYTDNIKDITQKSSKQKAIAKIEKDVADLESRIKNKKIKTSEALALLDKLTCL